MVRAVAGVAWETPDLGPPDLGPPDLGPETLVVGQKGLEYTVGCYVKIEFGILKRNSGFIVLSSSLIPKISITFLFFNGKLCGERLEFD